MELISRRHVAAFQCCFLLLCCASVLQAGLAESRKVTALANRPQPLRATVKTSVVAWPYDPTMQPITIAEIRRIIRSPKATPAMHSLVISRAHTSRLLEYAVEEYNKRRKSQPKNPVLQYAFGSAVISVNQRHYKPSNDALRRKQQESAFTRDAALAIENTVKGAGVNISFCQAAYGYMRVTPFPSPTENDEEYKQGIDALERAIQLDPKRANNYVALAWAYLTMNKSFDPQRSLDLSRKAAALNPKSSNAYYFQAIALLQLKRPKEADAVLVKSWALMPPNQRPKPPSKS